MKSRAKSKKIYFIVICSAAAAVLAGLFGTVIHFEITYKDRFFPGVFVGGQAVGGKTEVQVMTNFQEKKNAIAKNGLNIIFNGKNGVRHVNIPMSSEGLTPDVYVNYVTLGDVKPVVADAYNLGRSGNIVKRLASQLSLLFIKKNFSLSATLNESALKSLITGELETFLVKPESARFYTENGLVAILPEVKGESVNMVDVMAQIRENLASLDATPLHFEAQPNMPLTTAQKLQPYVNLAGEMSKKTSLVFTYKNYTWKVTGHTFITWLKIKENNNIGINSDKLDAFLSKTVALIISGPPQNPRFAIKNGRLVQTAPGRPGNVVDLQKTLQKVEDIIPADPATVVLNTFSIPIKTIESDPKITQETINQYRITDLLGTARTNFTGGSKDRQHNIEIGVLKMDGLLLAPGEEFSTLRVLGGITEEAGFVKEYVIKENKTVKELGGGLCQVSTTLFRLALDAGLKITARTNHRYVIPYYGPGLDATIYDPVLDLRFVNNTANYMLLQGTVKNNEVIFEFYGTDDGRKVEISKPELSNEKPAPETKNVLTPDLPVGQTKCSELPHKGVTADVVYTVTRQDGLVATQNFHSVYQPWQRVCLIGTGAIE